MSAPSGDLPAEQPPVLPVLSTLAPSAHPHIITTPARTGTNVELRIHTSLTVFEVAAAPWAPAVSGFVVTVLVHSVDAATGLPRHLPTAEPGEWSRAIFAGIDAAQGYFLGAVDPDTGEHRDGQLVYRLYLDTDRQVIRVPPRLVACPHYRMRTGDGDPEIRIVTTACPQALTTWPDGNRYSPLRTEGSTTAPGARWGLLSGRAGLAVAGCGHPAPAPIAISAAGAVTRSRRGSPPASAPAAPAG